MPDPSPAYIFKDRSTCPACKCSRLVMRYRSSFSEGGIAVFIKKYYGIDPDVLRLKPYELDQCLDCGFVFQRFIGDIDLLRDLYTKWVYNAKDPEVDIFTYKRDINEPLCSRDAHELMTAASYLGKDLCKMKTLDYGMGWGLWARISLFLGCQSYGYDLAENRMSYAEAKGVNTIRISEMLDRRFDFINTDQVFEHLADPLEAMEMLASCLSPGGILKVSVPSASAIEKIIESLCNNEFSGSYREIMPAHPLEHINSFTRSVIIKMSKKAGLYPVYPSKSDSFSFLRTNGAMNLIKPKNIIKELVRPFYQYRSRSNILFWLSN